MIMIVYDMRTQKWILLMLTYDTHVQCIACGCRGWGCCSICSPFIHGWWWFKYLSFLMFHSDRVSQLTSVASKGLMKLYEIIRFNKHVWKSSDLLQLFFPMHPRSHEDAAIVSFSRRCECPPSQTKQVPWRRMYSFIDPALFEVYQYVYVCTDYRFKHVEAYMHHVYCISTWLNYDLRNW